MMNELLISVGDLRERTGYEFMHCRMMNRSGERCPHRARTAITVHRVQAAVAVCHDCAVDVLTSDSRRGYSSALAAEE